ncbi:hypothetical protein RCL_jg14915.t1 [Rhizophagus clarus]|uniref:Uncharacterized protein n=1 Tax=Rhizophagus clarus TaxID=94130 RepID=A0A8H3M2E9_9GLOM|nr:hypothetical protein RCL_jg14915.t1 [Rhizophagus clarus]
MFSITSNENDEYEFEDDTPENPESPDCALRSTKLNICLIANIDHTIFNGDQQVTQTNLNRVLVPDNTEFNADDLVLRF